MNTFIRIKQSKKEKKKKNFFTCFIPVPSVLKVSGRDLHRKREFAFSIFHENPMGMEMDKIIIIIVIFV